MKTPNIHTSRENWLRAATDELRPYFKRLGYALPEKIRFSIAFTSLGKRARMPGECWHPQTSADQHYEIIVRADKSDPLEVLGVLVHELVHTLLPSEAKHGKDFKAMALRVGLDGKMRHAMPTDILNERLKAVLVNLGPLPHAMLNYYGSSSERPKKQVTRHLKAECPGAACGYKMQIAAKWARAGLPVCPINAKHGKLECDIPDDDENTTAANTNPTPKQKPAEFSEIKEITMRQANPTS